jgi:hypothetical protein
MASSIENKNFKEMKTIKLLILSSVVLLFVNTGCIEDFTILGNGISVTEGRITNEFNQVISEGAFNVHITKGQEFEVIVNAESNILPYIETDVTGNNLRIHINGFHIVKNRLPMEVYITLPYLDKVVQSGSGEITTDFFVAENFNLVISGSGSIETAIDAIIIDALISGSGNLFLSGNANIANFIISGSGEIDAYEFDLRDCNAKISGSGNLWTNVQRFLIASISGSGSIYYYGNPNIETHISGTGRVIKGN